ncbi:hypothetical protein TYRP_014651 [Tyrophagus putrescentiae]|nr:hypothetical protein TYRP_014651 [Tyrophagus putrescentiae]
MLLLLQCGNLPRKYRYGKGLRRIANHLLQLNRDNVGGSSRTDGRHHRRWPSVDQGRGPTNAVDNLVVGRQLLLRLVLLVDALHASGRQLLRRLWLVVVDVEGGRELGDVVVALPIGRHVEARLGGLRLRDDDVLDGVEALVHLRRKLILVLGNDVLQVLRHAVHRHRVRRRTSRGHRRAGRRLGAAWTGSSRRLAVRHAGALATRIERDRLRGHRRVGQVQARSSLLLLLVRRRRRLILRRLLRRFGRLGIEQVTVHRRLLRLVAVGNAVVLGGDDRLVAVPAGQVRP